MQEQTRALQTAFLADRTGGIITALALLVPVLLLVVGAGTDYAIAVSTRVKAQAAADAAAVAGAKELSLADANRESVPSVVAAVVNASLGANKQRLNDQTFAVTTNIVEQVGVPLQVDVNLSGEIKSAFGTRFGLGNLVVTVRSVAAVVGKPNICVLALDPSSMGTIYLQRNAKVIGQNCAVFSNSKHRNGIKAFHSSLLQATTICSAGGKVGSRGNFSPDPLTDCPQFDDPLAGLPEPTVGACTATNLVINNQTVTLSDGTYCGGITIKGSARVTFNTGTFILKDGPLLVSDTATIEGMNVGFYFTGANARFSFATGTTVNLTASKTGPLMGLLFFASRSQNGLTHEIFSDNARELLGTIYLPTGTISIDANQPIADKSAYTAIVAQKVIANSGPTITLNTNYDQTDVPVPTGIRGTGQPIALMQ